MAADDSTHKETNVMKKSHENESSETMNESQSNEWGEPSDIVEYPETLIEAPHFPREAVPKALADVASAFASGWKVSFEAALMMTVFLITVALGRTVKVDDREGRWHSLRFSILFAEPHRGHTRSMVAKMLHIFFNCRRSHLFAQALETCAAESGHATRARTGKQNAFTFKSHEINDRVQALYSNGNGFNGYSRVQDQEKGVYVISGGWDESIDSASSEHLPPFECTIQFEDAATYGCPPLNIENPGLRLSASVLTEASAQNQDAPSPCSGTGDPEILLRGVMEKAFRLRGSWSKGGHSLRLCPSARSIQLLQKFYCVNGASDERTIKNQLTIAGEILDTNIALAVIFHLFTEDEDEDISLNTWNAGASSGMCMHGLTAHKSSDAVAQNSRALAMRIVQHAAELGSVFTLGDLLQAQWVQEEDPDSVCHALRGLVGIGWIRQVKTDDVAEEDDYTFVFHPRVHQPSSDSTPDTT